MASPPGRSSSSSSRTRSRTGDGGKIICTAGPFTLQDTGSQINDLMIKKGANVRCNRPVAAWWLLGAAAAAGITAGVTAGGSDNPPPPASPRAIAAVDKDAGARVTARLRRTSGSTSAKCRARFALSSSPATTSPLDN
jgi:hypothetical protein